MRVDFGMAARWKAGRSCWASGRLTVDNFGTACLTRLGRMIEAIAMSSICNVDDERGVESPKQHV
jgi:hypothetical protein